MPDKKLDQKLVEQFKKQLVGLKEALLQDIKNMTSESAETEQNSSDAGHALHMADVATDMYDREFSLGLASNDRELLQKINSALQRIDERTFGLCTLCKKAIKPARLKAIPYVETCLDCQEGLEKKSSR